MMNGGYRFQIGGWNRLVQLSKNDFEAELSHMIETIREYWEMDQGGADRPRCVEEWIKVGIKVDGGKPSSRVEV